MGQHRNAEELYRAKAEKLEQALNKSVVQPWLAERCTLKMQTVLLTSFRGCDGVMKNDYGKKFTRIMRSTILKNADPSTTFFPKSTSEEGDVFKCFFDDIDHYPVHWLFHLLHAAEIVSYKCPHANQRTFWKRFYYWGLHELHVEPESEEQLDNRLKDNVEVEQ